MPTDCWVRSGRVTTEEAALLFLLSRRMPVQGAADTPELAFGDVRIDLRRAHARVAREFLNETYVGTVLST